MFAALLLLAPLARAQDAPRDETIMLPCDGKCAAITPPVGIKEPRPVFPAQFTYGNYSEGFVQLEFTIGTDGHVSDIRTVKLLGAQDFADSAKRTVQDWIYKPAMLDGEAITISHPLIVFFTVKGAQMGARPSISSAYQKAAALLRDGKLDDAGVTLAEALKQPKLNMYERGMLTNLTALTAMQRKDYAAARDALSIVRFYQDMVPPEVLRAMLRNNILANLSLGDMAEAVVSFRMLARTKGYDPADPIAKAVSDTLAKVNTLPYLSSPAKIPDGENADGYTFTLFRRAFTFTNIVGKLDRYTMVCRERQVESPIAEKVDWQVPKSWSGCTLFIRGTPGTTFNIVQYAPKPATP